VVVVVVAYKYYYSSIILERASLCLFLLQRWGGECDIIIFTAYSFMYLISSSSSSLQVLLLNNSWKSTNTFLESTNQYDIERYNTRHNSPLLLIKLLSYRFQKAIISPPPAAAG
jgi:hypothetical protein